MGNGYLTDEWKRFRHEVIELDNGMCRRCGRSGDGDVVLQVHHLRYCSGKKPWEYAYKDCITLCKGCHGREHGHVMPAIGWECVDEEDLGVQDGKCEKCGTSIRYVFFIDHPNWEPLAVGSECCDYLTGTEYASGKKESMIRFRSRQSRFVTSTRWCHASGYEHITQGKFEIQVHHSPDGHWLRVNGVSGRARFRTAHSAKERIFELVESGDLERYFRGR